jgi:hypothetical protein
MEKGECRYSRTKRASGNTGSTQKSFKEEKVMGSKDISPCKSCTRVKDPQDCDNKTCAAWREWWLKRWEAMRKRWLN